MDGGRQTMKWTNLLLEHYNIQMITITLYHTASNGVIEEGHRPIIDTLSNIMACSDEPKMIWIDH
jgi:hypothetical protein